MSELQRRKSAQRFALLWGLFGLMVVVLWRAVTALWQAGEDASQEVLLVLALSVALAACSIVSYVVGRKLPRSTTKRRVAALSASVFPLLQVISSANFLSQILGREACIRFPVQIGIVLAILVVDNRMIRRLGSTVPVEDGGSGHEPEEP